MSHRYFARPVAALVLTLPALGGIATAAHAATWSDWIPLADKVQGAVELRFRDAKKKGEPGFEYQFRNKYAQKVTVKYQVIGQDAAGTKQQVEQTVTLEPGEQKVKGGDQRIAFSQLSDVTVTDIQFSGTAPTPTDAGQHADSVGTILVKQQLAQARSDYQQAENDLQEANANAAASHAVTVRPKYSGIGEGDSDSAGAQSGTTTINPGTVVGSEAGVRTAQERVETARKRVEALEKQLGPSADTTAAPATTPSSTTKLTREQIQSLIDTAQKAAAASDWPKSETALRSLIEGAGPSLKDSDKATLHANLGIALQNQNKYTDAETAFRSAIKLAPDSAPYQNDLASALAAQNKLPDAEAAMREAIRLDPKEAAYQDNLGNVLQGEQKYADAVAAFKEAVRLNPNDETYKTHLKDAESKAKAS